MRKDGNRMNEFIKQLKNRRSIRSYKQVQIEDSLLHEILEAGKYAPSGMGDQSTLMVVLQNKEIINQILKMNAEAVGGADDPFYGAPTVVVVFADTSRDTYVEDGSLVMGNLMNAAFSLGVDSCWIHRAKQVFDSPQGRKLAQQWGVPDHYVGVGNCILGYRDEEYPEPAERKADFVRFVK